MSTAADTRSDKSNDSLFYFLHKNGVVKPMFYSYENVKKKHAFTESQKGNNIKDVFFLVLTYF